MPEDRRIVKVTLPGQSKSVTMTAAEYDSYARSLLKGASAQPERVEGRIPVQLAGPDGIPRVQNVSHEEYLTLVKRGEAPMLTPTGSEKVSASERQNLKYELSRSDQGKALVTTNAVTPGFSQIFQNIAVGSEQAAQTRAELLQGNKGLDLGIDMGLLLTGGGLVKKAIEKTGAKVATHGFSGFLNTMAANAAADTYLYTNYLMDYNKPFTSEGFATNLMTGALFAAPFAAAGALRSTVVKAAQGGLSAGADAMVGYGLLGGKRNVLANAAATRVVGRVVNRIKPKKKGGRPAGTAAIVDEVAEIEARVAKQAQQAQNFTPRNLGNISRRSLQELDETITSVAGVAGFGDEAIRNIDFKNMTKNIGAIDSSSKLLQSNIIDLNKAIQRATPKASVLDPGQQARYTVGMEDLARDLRTMGASDLADEVVKLSNPFVTKPNEAYGKLVQLRLNERLKGSGAENRLRQMIEDTAVFAQEADNGFKVNVAIDDLNKAVDDLRVMSSPNNLEAVTRESAEALVRNIDNQLENIRKSYKVLEEEGLITAKKRVALETNLTKVANNLKSAEASLLDAATINEVKTAAAQNMTDELAMLQRNEHPQAIEAMKRMEAAQAAKDIKDFGKTAVAALEKGAFAVTSASIGGVVALRALSRQEKNAFFEHVHEQVTRYGTSPPDMEQALGNFVAPIQLADPEGSFMAQSAAANMIYYLQSTLPKAPPTIYNSAVPRQEVDVFLQRFAAVMDPISVGYSALEGRVTPEMVSALRIARPAMYTEISNELSVALQNVNPEKVSRKTMNGVQTFLGGLDPLWGGESIMQLQSGYAQNQEQDRAINGPTGEFRNTNNPQQAGNNFTFAQRISSY